MAGKQATDRAEGGAGDDKEVVLVPVGDGAEPVAQAADERDDKGGEGGDDDRGGDDRGGDRRAGASDDDIRDDDDATGGGKGGDDRAQRPRLSRSERNSLRRRSKERDRTEIRFLRTRNEQAERTITTLAQRLDSLERGQVDGKIGQIKGAIARADATIIRATASGDEAAALEATTLKNNMTEQLRREEDRKAEVVQRSKAGGDRSAAPEREERRGGGNELPPAVLRNVENWMDRNPWFDPDLGDRDSRIARALDEEVLAEGFDPTNPEYYRELDRRIAEERPKLAVGGRRERRDERDDDRGDERGGREERRGADDRGGDDDRGGNGKDRGGERGNGARKPSGPKFRVGGVERALKSNEVFVTDERRKALEEMGAWDDVKLRNRYLSSYKRYDEEQAAKARDR